MTRALILAYEFPPFISVASLRPYSFFKYLKEHDIDSVVITRQWNNKYKSHLDYIAKSKTNTTIKEDSPSGKIIKTPYNPSIANKLLLKNLKSNTVQRIFALTEFISSHLFLTGPKACIYKEANNYLKKNKIDVIIATGDPFVLFIYASVLSKKYNIPWIADYRDAWSNDFSIKNNKLLMYFNNYLESKYVKTASYVITVSEYIKQHIKLVVQHNNFAIIPNGFDDSIINNLNVEQDMSNSLLIGYAGSILDWHPIKEFLKELNRIITKNSIKVQLNFYGINKKDELEKFINLTIPTLKPYVRFIDKLPNDELLKQLPKNNLLLLFNYYAHMGTKIYDYVGIKRKILFCYENDTEANDLKKEKYDAIEFENTNSQLQKEVIEKTFSGIIVQNKGQLEEVILECYNSVKKLGKLKCDSKNTNKYSRSHQVKRLSELIKNNILIQK